ncbi:Arm DNA-binding domain-containing protein [Burkholderia ubonensis]|uniref:Arm DNA-binding domain-containing protein n=1 Tax=Burkholderia ubonensis TaxID=101571 RepID=UPI000F5825E9|nr:Arm DNA-binding domain-containing protein [Burkholderia ubonensis]
MISALRREIGLGSYPAVSLKEAHLKAPAKRNEIAGDDLRSTYVIQLQAAEMLGPSWIPSTC